MTGIKGIIKITDKSEPVFTRKVCGEYELRLVKEDFIFCRRTELSCEKWRKEYEV